MSPFSHDADRNLLFAVLALQADCLTQSQFVEACTLWASRKETPLPDILAERGWLKPDERADIERLLERKLKKHGGDAKAGISEATAAGHIRQSLEAIPDSDVRASLMTPTPAGHVLLSTTAHSPEEGDRYTITRLHATGGIGRIWLARDATIGRDIALKDLRPERASNPAVWGRFLREAQITGQLEHPGIVPIYELGHREDGNPFYTMRFVKGRTLREAIQAYHQKRERGELGLLDLRELLTAFVGVCNAVAYAHSRGVIHRDLKPANVVLGEYGEVMVLDWGLAKEVRNTGPETTDHSPTSDAPSPGTRFEDTLEGQVLGTPAYMAPEQADGRLADIDARTDVYGLGAILYELLTGHTPFTGASTDEVLSRVRNLAPDRPRDRVPGTPPSLEAICLKALAKHPGERYPTAKTLAEDVSRFQADEPTTAYREPLAVRASRWARRHRSLVLSAFAALVVAVPILVTGMVLLNNSEQREREARKKEERERERAQTNYQRSLHAADALTEELARGIRPIAGTQTKTVLEILERGKKITDELLTDPDPAPEAMERKARMLVQFTELYREVNRSVPSRQAAEQSLVLFDRLLADRPDDRNLHIERAKARNRLGWTLSDQGYAFDALTTFRAVIAELEAVGAESDPRLAAVYLASAYTYEGNILALFGDHEGAEIAYRRGLEIRRKALASAPGDPALREQLTISLEKSGVFLQKISSDSKKKEGLKWLREGRTEMEAICAADHWNSVQHLQLSRMLSNLAENTTEAAEAIACVEAGEKLVERFLRRDPEHSLWQREDLRFRYLRIRSKLKDRNLPDTERAELRIADRKMHEEILGLIRQRHAEDPENYAWWQDVPRIEATLCLLQMNQATADMETAKLLAKPSGLVSPGVEYILASVRREAANAQIARAHELATSSIKEYQAIRARNPLDADVESRYLTALYYFWQVERMRNEPVAAQAARWDYDTKSIAQTHRLIVAYPTNKQWQALFQRSYFSLALTSRDTFQNPDWAVLERPEVVQSLMRLAAILVDLPTNAFEENREHGEPIREGVRGLLRQLNAKGLLPAEGKTILDRLSTMAKKG